jgi:hypothetical protein
MNEVEYIYEEIERWPAKYRLKLIERLLEKECTHGDHPKDVKTALYAAAHRLYLYEREKDGSTFEFVSGEEVKVKFQTPEGGCMWPHHVDSPICVYDRESYDKYESGEYKLPKRCLCGVELSYDKPVSVVLVEHGEMTGEMVLTVEYPLQRVVLSLGDDVSSPEDEVWTKRERLAVVGKPGDERPINEAAQAAVEPLRAALRKGTEALDDPYPEASMGAAVPKEDCVMCGSEIQRIIMRCQHSGHTLDAFASSNGIVRWSCPCGFFYEKAVTELPSLPDLVVIDNDCRRKDWP